MATADIFTERESWKSPLALSLGLHVVFFASIMIYGLVVGRFGTNWGADGAGDGAMSVSMVSTIPLPRPPAETQNIVANESKGLTETPPKVEEKTPPPDAIPVLDKHIRKIQPKPLPSNQNKPKPVAAPSNVVQYGEGGPVSGPYGNFSVAGAKGGFGFNGGSDFGNRFSWYVRQVQQTVSQNWLRYEIDPNITAGNRVYISFDIERNGRPTNIKLEQSSGIPSLDQSAMRAIQRISTFGPLPDQYNGSRVNVEFWFDYRR